MEEAGKNQIVGRLKRTRSQPAQHSSSKDGDI